jgi:hypothetical protein
MRNFLNIFLLTFNPTNEFMKQTLLFLFVMLLQLPSFAQQAQYIELTSDAIVYKTPSTSGQRITGNVEQSYEALSLTGQLMYPFVQEVMNTKGDWLELPSGWVQKKDTHPVAELRLTQINFDKAFIGKLIDPKYLTKKDKGLANDYGLYFIRPDENSNDVIVMISIFMNFNLCYTARIEGDLIKCDKFILVKPSQLDESLDGTSFTVYRENGALKIYQLNYGTRLKTVAIHEFLDEMYETDVFDFKKMNESDFSSMFQEIEKLGNPTRLCVSAGTVQSLTEEEIQF